MKKLFISILLIAASLSLGAQALPFVAADYNPTTLAKGGVSSTEVSSVAYASFANPAAIVFYDGTMDVSAGYVSWQPNSVKSSVITAGGAYKIGSKFGLSLGFSTGAYPEYGLVDLSGYEKGTFKPSDMQFGLGLACKVLPYLSLGANIGYASQKLSPDVSYGAFDADIYAMAKFGGLNVTLGVADLGGKVTSQSGTAFPLPSSAKAGVGYYMTPVEKHGIEVNGEASYYFSGDFSAAVGASYTYDGMFSVRAGYRYGGDSVIPSFVSAGLGVRFYGVKLDLVYLLGSTAMANTFGVSLGYAF